MFILISLMKREKYGGAHTPLANVENNLPDFFLHNKKGRKAIDSAVKELGNLGWVLIVQKRTGKGSDLHVSINPRKVREISEYVMYQK